MRIEIPTAREALLLIIETIDGKIPALATKVRDSINEGHEVLNSANGASNIQPSAKLRAYTDAEALQVALRVLSAHFVEVPMFINAAHEEFSKTSMSTVEGQQKQGRDPIPKGGDIIDGRGELKKIEVERLTETAILRTQAEEQEGESYLLEPIDPDLLNEQTQNLETLAGIMRRISE